MAKTVYTPEDVALQDGTELVLKPLPIAKLKRAMSYMEDAEDIQSEEDSYSFIVGLVEICVGNQLPKTTTDDDGNEVPYQLEETLDVPTGKRIIAVTTGVDFDNPNLAALALEAAQSGQS